MQEVEAIVLALEPRDSKVCERLDSLGLNILCSIFIYSQQCLAQQRGLCLLAVSLSKTHVSTVAHSVQTSLHQDEGDSPREAAHKQGKKEALGQAALTLLIKGFLKAGASDKLRRWVSISYRPNVLWLTTLPAWGTYFGASRKLPRKHREADFRSTQRKTLVSCDSTGSSKRHI